MDAESDSEVSLLEYIARSKPDLVRQNAFLGRGPEDCPPLDAVVASSHVPSNTTASTALVDLTQHSDEDSHADEPKAPVDEDHVLWTRKPAGQFLLQARYLFCTWPQCTTPKETVLDRIKLLPSYDFTVVCREDHADDAGEHLHAFIAFNKVNRKKGYKWLDDLAGQHGNYRAARNNQASVRYILKDGDVVFDGFNPTTFVANLEKHTKAKGPSKSMVMATMIKDGKTLDDLDELDPGWMMMNKRKAEEYLAWTQVKKARLAITPLPAIDLDSYEEDYDLEIATWILENIGKPRKFKQQQLYVWSDGPNVGKTNLVEKLAEHLVVYTLPKTPFVDGYESNRFDLVLCDEFKAQFTIQFLNEFLQGAKSGMHLNQKGSGHRKTDNPPMIFLSNHSLADCYSKQSALNTGQFQALEARFKIVKIPAGKKIDIFHTLPLEEQ